MIPVAPAPAALLLLFRSRCGVTGFLEDDDIIDIDGGTMSG
jgi:hypothetical protein